MKRQRARHPLMPQNLFDLEGSCSTPCECPTCGEKIRTSERSDLASTFTEFLEPRLKRARSDRERRRLVMHGVLAWNLSLATPRIAGRLRTLVGDGAYDALERDGVLELAEEKRRRFGGDDRFIAAYRTRQEGAVLHVDIAELPSRPSATLTVPNPGRTLRLR